MIACFSQCFCVQRDINSTDVDVFSSTWRGLLLALLLDITVSWGNDGAKRLHYLHHLVSQALPVSFGARRNHTAGLAELLCDILGIKMTNWKTLFWFPNWSVAVIIVSSNFDWLNKKFSFVQQWKFHNSVIPIYLCTLTWKTPFPLSNRASLNIHYTCPSCLPLGSPLKRRGPWWPAATAAAGMEVSALAQSDGSRPRRVTRNQSD